MCQSIPACYDKGERNVFWELREQIRDFIDRNPGANDEDIKTIVAQLCAKRCYKVEILLNSFKRDLDTGKKLVNDPNELEAVREIQKMYCECYERVLSAHGLL